MHLFKKIYYQHVRNAVLDICAKSVPVWGKSGEMRGLLPGSEKNYLGMSFIMIIEEKLFVMLSVKHF